MFNNVNTTNVVTNTNNVKRTTPGFYTIAEIIAILNTITHTSFSISIKALSYGCIWIYEKSSDWKDERSFYLLRSMVRT